jgi:hypothetical protein
MEKKEKIMPFPMKKNWFDTHVEVIGLDEKENKVVKEKIKARLYAKNESRKKQS